MGGGEEELRGTHNILDDIMFNVLKSPPLPPRRGAYSLENEVEIVRVYCRPLDGISSLSGGIIRTFACTNPTSHIKAAF